MQLTGYIYDNTSGQGVPFASVMITDYEGQSLQDGTAANQYGYFEITSSKLDTEGWLYVSSSGYQPVLVNPGVFQESGDIGLDRAGDLVPVVVTAKPKSNQDWLIWLLFGGGLVLLISTSQRKRRVKGVTPQEVQDWVKIALYVGVPIGIFFLVVKPILESLGLLKDKKDRQQDASDQAAQDEQENLADYRGTDNHTYNQTTLDSIAVALRNDTTDWWGYEWIDLVKQLAYFTAFTAADAKYFLGTFVKKNGYTLWQWYFQEFEDALIFDKFDWGNVYWNPGWGGTGAPRDYRANYQKLGITESNANKFSWPQVVEKFVSYVYTVAGVAKQ